MKKRLITITVAAGVISFAGAFAAGWFTKPAAVMGSPAPNQADPAVNTTSGLSPQILTPTMASPDTSTGTRVMAEQHLKELIFEVRERIQEYNSKLEGLEKERERFRIAQQTLKKDIESLNNLHVDLAATVANVKSERDMLLKTRVEIERVEKRNLMAIAAAYDKMDPTSASEILTNMALGQSKTGVNARSANIDDAVRILHFMQDRTKAKVLAELVTSDPTLAALLCQKLKQVQEGK